MDPSASNLDWFDGRWHCAGSGIHAGDSLELRACRTVAGYDDGGRAIDGGPGPWIPVRIESADNGRVLVAHLFHQGVGFACRVGPDHELRWPEGQRGGGLFGGFDDDDDDDESGSGSGPVSD